MKEIRAFLRRGVCIFLGLLLLSVTGCDNVSDRADDGTASTGATADVVTTTQSVIDIDGDICTTTLSNAAVSECSTDVSTSATNTTTTTAPADETGTAIAFRENANVRVRFDEGVLVYPADFDGYVVHSKAEYDALQLDALEMYAPSHSQEYEALDLTPYTEAYFTDKALVVLYLSSGAGNVQMRVDALTVEDIYFLNVTYTEESPTTVTTAGSDWCLLLEVDAAAVKDVTYVTGVRTKVVLPE